MTMFNPCYNTCIIIKQRNIVNHLINKLCRLHSLTTNITVQDGSNQNMVSYIYVIYYCYKLLSLYWLAEERMEYSSGIRFVVKIDNSLILYIIF